MAKNENGRRGEALPREELREAHPSRSVELTEEQLERVAGGNPQLAVLGTSAARHDSKADPLYNPYITVSY